jgi:hypothetical protein
VKIENKQKKSEMNFRNGPWIILNKETLIVPINHLLMKYKEKYFKAILQQKIVPRNHFF